MRKNSFFTWGNSLCVALILILTGCSPQSKNATSGMSLAESIPSIDEAFQAYIQGDCQEAIALFSQINAVHSHPSVLNGLGISYLQCEQAERAEGMFKNALQLVPNSAEIYANLGTAYFEQSEYRKAEENFDHALNINPLLIEAINGKAALYIVNNEPEKAIKMLYEYTKQSSTPSELSYNYALALYDAKLISEAIVELEKHLQQHPKSAMGHNSLAVMLEENKEYDKALQHSNIAIGEFPINGEFYYNRGNIYKAMNKPETALKDYSRAIAYEPELAEAYINRGDVYFLLNQAENACIDLKKACDMGLCERFKTYKKAGRCLSDFWQ